MWEKVVFMTEQDSSGCNGGGASVWMQLAKHRLGQAWRVLS